MAKQLNVNLAFNANTSGAIKNLNELNQALSKLGSIDIKSNGLSAEMKQAALSAQELQMHLNRAYDSKLGNLNLNKFEQSLKSSNTSLSKLSTDLLGAGRNGEQAFLRLQSSIASANTQLVQSKGLLAEFATTLKNTARWQLSSSVLHGFMGAMQSAYSYSQRLNESLNNIRIVTGYNVDKMAEFAEEANRAAKALSTSTTDYTNASLIYYQQGLNDSEVQKRTDITVKMANVANKTAAEVSDQMTAVWNNFYDGSKSLEYYADVMTALGAATASSTDEIAGGLEKFAAIADTIGLSYEYAASALATITSNTRQSEEVVGTALKTIFARIQGLNLGETLDDGTTLNKYSEALQKVGISIFDTAGNLREMDDILDDMGNKWEHLNKAQQTALAQTVAGTRQYTQLVALMDNWNKGDSDSFQANLATAYGSEGALAEQHAIYEQGWEAAQKRVKAGWEAIYKELVPDEAFIKLYDGFADILGIIEAVVKTAGGLEGIIMLAASAMMNKFAPAIGEGIQSGIQKLDIFKDKVKNIFTGGDGSVLTAIQGGFTAMKNPIATLKGENTNPYSAAEKSTERIAQNLQVGTTHIQQQVTQSLKVAESWAGVTVGFQQQIKMQQEMNSLTNVVAGNTKNLSKATQERLMHEIQTTEELGIQAAELTQQVEDTRELISSNVNSALTEESLRGSITAAARHPAGDPDTVIQTASLALPQNLSEDAQLYMQSLLGAEASIESIGEGMNALMIPSQNVKASIQDFSVAADMALSDISELSSLMQILDQINIDDNFGSADQKAKAMSDAINAAKNLSDPLKKNLLDMVGSYSQMSKSDFTKGLQKQLKTVQSAAKAYKVQEEHIGNAVKLGSQLGTTTQKNTQVTNQYNRALQNVKDNINNALKASLKLGPTLAKGFSSLSSVGMSVNMISNAFDTLTDSSTSWTQKLSSGLMALSMSFQAVATVSGMFKSSMAAISGIIATQNAQTAMNTIVTAAATKAQGALTGEQAKRTTGIIALIAAQKLEKGATEASVQEWVKEQLIKKMGVSQDEASALAITMVTGAKRLEGGALKGVAPAKAADMVLTEGQTAANWKEVASLAAKNWWLLLIIAALAILVGGIIAVVNARKAGVEANKKSAEADREAAAAAKEEAEANRDLVNSYHDMLKTYQETGEGKEECQKAALEAAKAYGIEGAEVLILAGKYDELNKRIREKQKLENNKVKQTTDQAKSSVTLAMSDALRDGDGYKTTSGGYYGQFDNGMSNADEQAAYKALESGKYTYLQRTGGEIAFNVEDISSPEQMYAYYQELEKFLAEQRRIADKENINLGASEIYQDALAEYNSGLEYYDQLKELMGESEVLGHEMLALESTTLTGKGLEDISSLKEYEEFQADYLKRQQDQLLAEGVESNSDEWNSRMESAKEYLGTLDGIREFYLESQSFDSLMVEGDEEQQDRMAKIKEWYNGLSEADQTLFWQLDINENSSLDSVQETMKTLQNYADTHGLMTTIKVAADMEGLLTSDTKDWTKIREQWDKGGFGQTEEDWLKFLAMSDEERLNFIEQHQSGAIGIAANAAPKAIEQTSNTYTQAQADRDAMSTTIAEKEAEWEDVSTRYLSAKNGISSFYTMATRGNYDENLLAGGSGWSTLLNEDTLHLTNLTDQERAFATAMSVGDDDRWSQFYNYAQNYLTKDDKLAMSYFEGTNLVTNDANGELMWNTDWLHFDENGKLLDQSWSTVADYGRTTKVGGIAAAEHLISGNSFNTDRANQETADALYSDYLQLQEELGDTDAGTGLRGEQAKLDTAVTEAMTQHEQALKDQADWDDAFEARSEALGLESEAVNAYADSLLEMAETGELVSEDLQDQTNASKILAQSIQRMNKGVSDLGDNWKDYTKALNPNKKLTAEYAKSMSALRGNVEDILDLDMTNFSDGWFESTENMKLFERIAKGDMTAIDDLRLAATEEILFQAGLDTTEAETHAASLMDTLESIPDLKIGTTVDISQAAGALWDLYEAGEITAQGLQEALNGIGWEPQIEYDTMTVAEAKQHGQTAEVLMADGSIATVDLNNYASDTTVLRIPHLSSSKATYRGAGSVAQPPAMDNSGGGGGGSKPKLKNDSDKTRYHTLENQLEDLKSEYEDISDAVDRAFGKDKLKLMDEQIAKTDELIDKQEEYVAAIAADLPKDKAVMEAYYDDLIGGPAIEFDEKGNIANYDAIQDAMYAMYNENAENMSAEDWEIFEQKYEQLEKYIEQYEETYDMLRDEEQELQDLVNQRLDQELAKIQYTIELKMNVADDALEVLEYQLGRLEDDAFAAAEAIALLGDKAGQLQNKMAAAREGIDSILGQSLSSSEIELFMSGDTSILEGKTFTEEQMNQLREYRSELLSLNEELLQVREDVQSKVMDTFDAWNEKLQKGIEKFDHYSSVLTSYKNIVDLVGKSYLGVDNELLKSMNDAMIENSINKVGATRAAYEALLESQANAQAQYEAAVASGNENDIKFWADTLETIGEEVDAAQENMMAAWEESLQLAAEEFQRQVDVALEEFNTALTGFASMEEFRENFDFAKEVEEEYVPAYEKIYELSKLNRDINKTLNDDRVIKGKEKLLELQEKINQYQQDGVEMSEYEIANLQREYDLRMAEIALEEARNAKDTVRMSKDNEGNWSYVYTTNTEAVDTAQQDYEDALFAMQQANDEYLDEMSNLILDATQRMNEEIAALRLEDFANQEEYDAKVQEITEKYMGRIQYGQEQMQKALDNNAILYENDWTAYSEATGYKIATDQEYVDSFDETVLGKLLNSESQVVNVYEMINEQIGGLLEATSGAYSSWSSQVDEANQAAGTSTEDFAEDMDNAINGPGGISESSEDAADSVYDMAEDMIDDFDRVAKAVSDWQRSYSDDIDTIIQKNLDAIEVCNALLSVLSNVQDVDLSNLTPTYDPYGKTYDNTTNSKDKDEEVVVVPVEQRGGDDDTVVGGGGRNTGIDTKPWRKEASFTHFASGGYTGEWGDDGKLAVLHQKELVLNAEDTTNMFKALNLTRQILDTIDLNAQYASGGLGQVMASSIRDAITQTLEQHVTIEADFPSVTDHNEIEIAMKNLINTASQFAHRK